MSAHEEEMAGGTERQANDENEENSLKLSPEIVDERITANYEPLHAQLSALRDDGPFDPMELGQGI